MKSLLLLIAAGIGYCPSLAGAELKADPAKPVELRVTEPPKDWKLDPFYKKHVSVQGFPVIGSARVSDFALLEAAYLVGEMLKDRPDVLAALIENKIRFVVMASSERTTDVPEHSDLEPGKFWDRRARGLGATRIRPAVSCGEENLLGFPGDPYAKENILVHEFAHAIHLMGLNRVDKTFDERLKRLYDSAMERGLWKGKYAATNHAEYWAEGVQSWFDTNRPPDHDHNHVDTRAELEEYDPDLAALIAEVFKNSKWRYSRPADRKEKGHLEGYDPGQAPAFAWDPELQKWYDNYQAEQKQLVQTKSAVAAPHAVNDLPNVIMIVGDDQGWGDFGFMGHDIIRTPHLDKLAAESALFPNGYTPTSLCRASLASILTGLYAHQHHICCNDPPEGVDRAAMHPFIKQAPALPRLLKEAGYASLQTGKFWEGHYSNAGFTNGMTTRGRHGEEGLVIGRQTMQPIYDFIGQHRKQPFFIWYAPMLPHEPHNPPARFLKRYIAPGRPERLAKYYAMCEWFDETCGELLDWLDREEFRQNTLIVFVIDNGWIQETGPVQTTRGWFAPKSKLSPYDGGLRSPVLLRWPGHTRPGRYEDLVSTIDLAPTILAAVGLKPPEPMQGLSLQGVAAGQGKLPRTAVFGELYLHTAVDLERTELNLTHRWVREGNWKLIVPSDAKSRSELYDLATDPRETKDLAASNADRVRQLQAVLDGWWKAR